MIVQVKESFYLSKLSSIWFFIPVIFCLILDGRYKKIWSAKKGVGVGIEPPESALGRHYQIWSVFKVKRYIEYSIILSNGMVSNMTVKFHAFKCNALAWNCFLLVIWFSKRCCCVWQIFYSSFTNSITQLDKALVITRRFFDFAKQ
jgi:hypothetical protein